MCIRDSSIPNPGLVNLSNTHPEERCVRRAGWFARYHAVGWTSARQPLLSPTKGHLEPGKPLPLSSHLISLHLKDHLHRRPGVHVVKTERVAAHGPLDLNNGGGAHPREIPDALQLPADFRALLLKDQLDGIFSAAS